MIESSASLARFESSRAARRQTYEIAKLGCGRDRGRQSPRYSSISSPTIPTDQHNSVVREAQRTHGNAEEGKRDSESETTGPNKSDTSTDSGLNLRSGKGDDEVEEPVGTGTEGDTPRRQPNGESLTADNPGNGTPRRRERGNEKTGEGNENITGNLVIRVGLGDSTDNNLTNKHENATNEEDRSSTRSVDSKNTGERENDVDGSENDLEDVGVVKTGSLGELDTVREEEVDTGDLLANLDTDTDHSSPENSVLGRETFDIAGLTALLVFDGSLTDFFHLGLYHTISKRSLITIT